jgi:hypothetical protein
MSDEERIEELEDAIRTALDALEDWADGDKPQCDFRSILASLEAALITDDTVIALAEFVHEVEP